MNKYYKQQSAREEIVDNVERPILHLVVNQVRRRNVVSEQLKEEMDQGFWNDMFEATQLSIRPMLIDMRNGNKW